VEHEARVIFRWGSAGKITGPTEEQALLATVADLPPLLLEPPESVALAPGKPARLRVLVSRFDGGLKPLTLEPDVPIPGLKIENNTVAPGANQAELRLTAEGEIRGALRLRAGQTRSPEIELRPDTGSEEEKR
jgi:hypothetical protein